MMDSFDLFRSVEWRNLNNATNEQTTQISFISQIQLDYLTGNNHKNVIGGRNLSLGTQLQRYMVPGCRKDTLKNIEYQIYFVGMCSCDFFVKQSNEKVKVCSTKVQIIKLNHCLLVQRSRYWRIKR